MFECAAVGTGLGVAFDGENWISVWGLTQGVNGNNEPATFSLLV